MKGAPEPAADAAVELQGVGMIFGAQPGRCVDVFQNLSVTVRQGETVAFVGPSGCGKTTLLRLVAGLEEPTAGTVLVSGRQPLEARRLGWYSMLFQTPVLLPWLNLQRNVELPGKLLGDEAVVAKSAQRIAEVGLSGFENAYPHELSGGMKARAALARAFTVEPRLLLMDEPFASLDAMTRLQMQDELLRVLDRGKVTVVLVTHDIEEAVYLADRVLVLSERPARVRETVWVELPAACDRTRAVRSTVEFQQCRARIEHLIIGPADQTHSASPVGTTL